MLISVIKARPRGWRGWPVVRVLQIGSRLVILVLVDGREVLVGEPDGGARVLASRALSQKPEFWS